MGAGLPKAVESIVVERHGGRLFRVGMAEMNGWRPSMEDSHVVVMRDSWGFFGVFDGHGGSQCSAFVARKLTDELSAATALPKDDATVKSMMLRLDRDFLESKQPSGSTGTFVFVEPPNTSEGGDSKRHTLRVGNIGDSRVLLGRADGTLAEGQGTDGGLTTDHKPDHPSERERIERTGGSVQMVSGIARVNGDLAVSRAFGDAQHKETGGPNLEDHPVSAEPECTTLQCDPTDFLVLVCDGISEGNFPNREVVELAAEGLRRGSEGGRQADLGEVAASVCRRALERGSMDNLSCMLVQFQEGEGKETATYRELLPGPFSAPEHNAFRKAYAIMAERAGVSLAQAVEKRYDALRKERVEALKRDSENGDADAGEQPAARRTDELRAEIVKFGDGPPGNLAPGTEARLKWFQDWLDCQEVEPAMDPASMSRGQLLSMLAANPDMLAQAKAQGMVAKDAMRTVEVAPLEKLKPAVEAHTALKWDKRLESICSQRGRVLQDDPSDGTSQVQFREPVSATAWLPTSALTDCREEGPKVRVCEESELKPAIEANENLKWHEDISTLCGQCGRVVEEDALDGTSKVVFPPPVATTAWLPTACLKEVEEEDAYVVAPALERLKPAVDAHASLTWHERLEGICGQRGLVVREDSDGTSQVKFPPPHSMAVWLPTDVLVSVEPEAEPDAKPDELTPPDAPPTEAKAEAADPPAGSEEPEAKRQRAS